MIWEWVERAAYVIMAARFAFHAVRDWRGDEDVGEVFGLVFPSAMFAFLAFTAPIGNMIMSIGLLGLSVVPGRWYGKFLYKLLRPKEIGPSTQESDKQLKE